MNDREWNLMRLNIIKSNLKEYRDSWFESTKHGKSRPCIVWKDGDLGMGWASHMTGDPGGFKLIGFKDYVDFYKLPPEKRNEFLNKGLKIFIKIFRDQKIKGKIKEIEEKRELVERELKALAKGYNKYKRRTCYDTKITCPNPSDGIAESVFGN